MKKLLLLLTAVFIYGFTSAQNLHVADSIWDKIKTETAKGANTASRIGTAGEYIISGVRDTLSGFVKDADLSTYATLDTISYYKKDSTWVSIQTNSVAPTTGGAAYLSYIAGSSFLTNSTGAAVGVINDSVSVYASGENPRTTFTNTLTKNYAPSSYYQPATFYKKTKLDSLYSSSDEPTYIYNYDGMNYTRTLYGNSGNIFLRSLYLPGSNTNSNTIYDALGVNALLQSSIGTTTSQAKYYGAAGNNLVISNWTSVSGNNYVDYYGTGGKKMIRYTPTSTEIGREDSLKIRFNKDSTIIYGVTPKRFIYSDVNEQGVCDFAGNVYVKALADGTINYNFFGGYEGIFSGSTELKYAGFNGSAFVYSVTDSTMLNQQNGNTSITLKSDSVLFRQPTNLPLAYGGLYVSDGTTAQNIPTGMTYTKLTAFTNADDNYMVTCAGDSMIAQISGTYEFKCYLHLASGTNNVNTFGAIFVNGVEQNDVHFERLISILGDVGSISCGGKIYLNAGDDIDFRLRTDDAGTVAITTHYANIGMNLIRKH